MLAHAGEVALGRVGLLAEVHLAGDDLAGDEAEQRCDAVLVGLQGVAHADLDRGLAGRDPVADRVEP